MLKMFDVNMTKTNKMQLSTRPVRVTAVPDVSVVDGNRDEDVVVVETPVGVLGVVVTFMCSAALQRSV